MVKPITKAERQTLCDGVVAPRYFDTATGQLSVQRIVNAYEAALTAYEARIKELEKALEWYADNANWKMRIYPKGSGNLTCDAYYDHGSRASKALEEMK